MALTGTYDYVICILDISYEVCFYLQGLGSNRLKYDNVI